MFNRYLFGNQSLRASCVPVVLTTAGFLAVTPVAWSQSEDPPPVVRIEEDWMLVLNEPDEDVDSPQFHTVMSPSNTTDSNYAQVLWNYREVSGFVSGGVQLNSYDDDFRLRYRSVETRQLSNTAETITWTQGLSTDGVMLSFDISNGQSTTWGTFGRDMRIDESANLPSLNEYTPETSVENSCITYGSNRVELLMITGVRYYAADGLLLSVDTTPRVVYEFGDDE